MGRRRFPVVSRALLALIAVSTILSGRSGAEGLSGYLEYNYSKTDSESVDATGRSTKQQFDSFLQRYSVTLDKKFFPNLGILAGGFFDKQATNVDLDGQESDSSKTTIRPYVNLYLRTPLYYAEADYNRNEEKTKVSGVSSVTTVREAYTSTVYWKPEGSPDAKVQYARNDNFDKERKFLDTTENRFEFTTQYWPVKSVYLRYKGFIDERKDRLNGTTADEVNHDGKFTYSDSWWQRRVSVSSDYSFSNDETKIVAGGAGEVGFRVFPLAGLSLITDFPETGALDSNPSLVDGDLAIGAGINLGLPGSGDARPRNFGLDLATPTEVNTLLVFVDQDVTQVADAFSWRVSTSENNLNWTPPQVVASAVFSAFFRRFEIRFANVRARYVKLVVSPLSAATPFATGFPNIFVTELQGELRRPAAEVVGKQTATTHIYNLGVRTRILENPSLFYEFSYFLIKREPSATPSTYNISNGLAFQHQFSKVFSGRARVSREDGQERDGVRTSYLYTAGVTAVPLDTLFHSLVFSGKNETIAGQTNTASSLFLYNNAKLYEGIDVSLGGGASFAEDATGKKTDGTQVNASATLVPNTTVTINIIYNGTGTKSTGGDTPGGSTSSIQAWETNVSIVPVRTVYLFGSYRVEDQDQGGGKSRRTIQNYTANWSPFPDGTLHLNLFYVETIRSEDDARERSIVPNLRWNMTPRSHLDLSYQWLKTESVVQTTENRVASATIRLSF
jgi:hypothetical protein